MPEAEIRAYRAGDEAALMAAWNAALPYDPVDVATFRRQVLLDPNFEPAGLHLAEVNREVAGFCLGIVRRAPFEELGLEPERGWITAFGVRPEQRRRGLGAALLEAALNWFESKGRREVLIAPYVPYYFVPGVDEIHYEDGLQFLLRRGFEVISRPLSMDANLVRLDLSAYETRRAQLAARGVTVRSLRGDEIPLLTAFLAAHMPGDWLRSARALVAPLADRDTIDAVQVAIEGDEVVGYCQFEREHFGPFGVRADRRGEGIGTVLLASALAAMRRQGLHSAWVLWTSDETAERVYSRFGFAETRRFSVVRRRLGRAHHDSVQT